MTNITKNVENRGRFEGRFFTFLAILAVLMIFPVSAALERIYVFEKDIFGNDVIKIGIAEIPAGITTTIIQNITGNLSCSICNNSAQWNTSFLTTQGFTFNGSTGSIVMTQSGSTIWIIGANNRLEFTTPGGFAGIVGFYLGSSLWSIGGKTGQAYFTRTGEYGFKHYTGGYMELGFPADVTLAYAQMFIYNSVANTKRTFVLRAATNQNVSIFEIQNSSASVVFWVNQSGIVSAKDYLYGSPSFSGDALSQIKNMKTNNIKANGWGEADHKSFGDAYAGNVCINSTVEAYTDAKNRTIYKYLYECNEQISLINLVALQTRAIQQLEERIKILEGK